MFRATTRQTKGLIVPLLVLFFLCSLRQRQSLNLVLKAIKNEAETTALTGDAVPPAELAFSKLQLFVTTFPGNLKGLDKNHPEDNNEESTMNGFVELRETFLRTLQFFWPRKPHWKLTVVLDDPPNANATEREYLTNKVWSLFEERQHDEKVRNSVSIEFNPLTNQSLYGTGWYIQQLIMLWADNFTDAEYIGFVDDDTIFTKAVQPIDLFDESGRPRALVRPRRGAHSATWVKATDYAFGRLSEVFSMVSFPVIIKREHLREMREEILRVHSEYSYFDEFFSALIHRGRPRKDLTQISQFCFFMDFVFEKHRNEYRWHFETASRNTTASTYSATAARNTTNHTMGPPLEPEMFDLLPRISQHFTWIFVSQKIRYREIKTVAGRRNNLAYIMREGYCYSLPLGNLTAIDEQRCRMFDVQNGAYAKGEWEFENHFSVWHNTSEAAVAHKKRAAHNTIREWNEDMIKQLFPDT